MSRQSFSTAPCYEKRATDAFTLIELLVVISIIAILASLAFPAVQGALDSGKKAQARNDLQQLVMAIKAYQLEYGKLPVKSGNSGDFDYGDANINTLMDVLRGIGSSGDGAELNPRNIPFIEPRVSKNNKAGLGDGGKFYDPWGSVYKVRLDNNYDNQIKNFYTGNSAGWDTLNLSVIAVSAGPDKTFGIDKNKNSDTNAKDDLVSWQ